MTKPLTNYAGGFLVALGFLVAVAASWAEPYLKANATDEALWEIQEKDTLNRAGELAFLARDGLARNRTKLLQDMRANIRDKMWVEYSKLAAVAAVGFLSCAAVFGCRAGMYPVALVLTLVLAIAAAVNLAYVVQDLFGGNPLLFSIFIARAVLLGGILVGFLVLVFPSTRRCLR